MALPDIVIIWADVSFDKEGRYQSMTDEFNRHTAAASPPPRSPDEIDILICFLMEDLRTNGAPLITVKSADEAIKEIVQHPGKKIFFITSGTLGRYLVPEIVSHYPQIQSFYIYCHNMSLHVDWAIDYLQCLQMFNHQVDLLIRLTRDIARYFIDQGRMYLQIENPTAALTCFEHARTLEQRANTRDTLNTPFYEHLKILEGHNGNTGLIQQARAMKNDQEANQPSR